MRNVSYGVIVLSKDGIFVILEIILIDFWIFYHGTNVTSWVPVHPRPHMALVLRPPRKFVVYLDVALYHIILHMQKASVLENIILTQKKSLVSQTKMKIIITTNFLVYLSSKALAVLYTFGLKL